MPQQIEIPGQGIVEFPDGMTDAQIAAAIKKSSSQPSTVMDVAKSAGSGLVKGAAGLMGLPGDLNALVGIGVEKAGRALGFEPAPVEQRPTTPLLPTSQDIKGGIEKNITGPLYKPQTTPGEYAQTVGEFAPAALVGPGGLVRKGITQALIPGAASEAAGRATQGTDAEPYARVAGALGGSLVPGMARRAVTPNPISPERERLVNVLRAEGIEPTAGQTTGRESLRYAESVLGNAPLSGGAGAARMEQQGEQFTGAVLRRVGENATRATPEVVDRAFTRIGQQFDDLAARNSLQGDRQLGNEFVNIERQYQSVTPPSARAPIVENTIREVGDAIANNQGILQGQAYQALRSRLDKQARAARNDPQLQEALFGLRNSLDDAMERTLTTVNPADLGAWREARRQYRDMLVVEKAATGAGENAAMGLISPSQLRNATVGQNRRQYARGQGDFGELARAGEAVLKPLPQSGTQPRAFVGAIPAAVGGTIGGSVGGLPGAGVGIVGALAASAAPGIAGRALMSGPVQRYLGNQAVQPGRQLSPSQQMILQALLSEPRLELRNQ